MRREDKILREAMIEEYWQQLYENARRKNMKYFKDLDGIGRDFLTRFSLETVELEISLEHTISWFASYYHYPPRIVKQQLKKRLAQLEKQRFQQMATQLET